MAVEVLNASSQVVRTLAGSFSYSSGGRASPGAGETRPAISFMTVGTASALRPPPRASRRGRATASWSTARSATSQIAPTPFSPDGRRPARLDGDRIQSRPRCRRAGADHGRRADRGHRPPLGALAAGPASLSWGGRNRDGAVADGRYRALVEATTSLGTRVLSVPLVIDTRDPVVRIDSARHRKDGRTAVRLWLSEPAMVRLRYGSPELFGLRESPAPGRLLRAHAPRVRRASGRRPRMRRPTSARVSPLSLGR